MHFRAKREDNADEARGNGGKEPEARAAAGSKREHGHEERHIERARVVERHGRAERQYAEGPEPDREAERTEEASFHMRKEELRSQRLPLKKHPECDHNHAEKRAVEDELKGGEMFCAELRADSHQRKEKSCGEHPEALHERVSGSGEVEGKETKAPQFVRGFRWSLKREEVPSKKASGRDYC